MNDKEFNLQILAALVEYTNELIAAGRVTVEESGQYTAANLANRKNDMCEYLHIDMIGQNEPKTLQVGGFSCTVTPYTVFAIICKFEKICGVRGDKKARFAFGDITQNCIIKGKSMFADANGKPITRTKTLRRYSEHIATDKNEDRYFQVRPGGVWYWIANKYAPFDVIISKMTKEFLRTWVELMRRNRSGSSFRQIMEAMLAEWEAEPNEKAEVKTKPIEQEKPKRTQGARFTFSMCGIKPGEKIVFTPEQIEVTVADDTHVEFCGELFTLSGFCRAFMPDGPRKPSNASQGPTSFTYDGVTLVKLRADKTACVEVETQEVQTEEKTAATPSDLTQERTEAHGLTAYRTEKNNSLKRTFLQQTNTSVLRIFNRFSTENRRKNTKCGEFSSQMVVHTLPVPPPYHRQQIK